MVNGRAGVGARSFPRVDRLNRVLCEVLAESVERLADTEERLELVTVTSVSVDPDLRHCTVFISRDDEGVLAALEEKRGWLQAQVARQTSLKRTPLLSFRVDPSLLTGLRIEGILRTMHVDGLLGTDEVDDDGADGELAKDEGNL